MATINTWDSEGSEYEILFHTEDPTLSYETDEFIIVRRKSDGRILWGEDGGCSCYEGFDDDNLTSGNRQRLIQDFSFWNPQDDFQGHVERMEQFQKALNGLDLS